MKNCRNCKHADPAVDTNGVGFFYCRLIPPQPVMIENQLHAWVPMMTPIGWCGQFGFSLRNWLRSTFRKGNGARA